MEIAANPTESAGEEDTGDDGAVVEAEEEQQDNDQQAQEEGEEDAVINGAAEEEEEQEESNPTEQVTNQVANCMVIDLNWISLPHPFYFFFFPEKLLQESAFFVAYISFPSSCNFPFFPSTFSD